MTTVSKPTTKAKRTLRFTANTDEFSPTAGRLILSVGRDTSTYVVTEFATGHVGRGFVLSKVCGDMTGSTVQCGPRGDTCDCEGFRYRCNCKHVASVRLLIDSGRL